VDFAHDARYWEYALGLRVFLQSGATSVLDVGGGGALFSPLVAKCGAAVTQIDPGDFSGIVAAESRVIEVPIGFAISDTFGWNDGPYDMVACLSVIEHVPDHELFFHKLCTLVKHKGVLFLTTDFHPSGQAQVEGHLRTYNQDSLESLVKKAARHKMKPLGKPNWSYFGQHVYQYNFCSLALKR
jgi:SAM-dependent methyltransferase